MKKMKYRVVGFIVFMIMLLTACRNTSVDFADLQVVQILCEGQKGSGVIYDIANGTVVIVTAAHVVEGADCAQIVWNNQSQEKTETDHIYKVQGLDLAFLRVDEAMGTWSVCGDIVSDAHEKNEESLQELNLQGYDAYGTLRNTNAQILEEWIYVEDFGCHMMLGKGMAEAGMSGGPAWDDAESFAGIICGIDENNNVAILPASVIKSEYSVLDWSE